MTDQIKNVERLYSLPRVVLQQGFGLVVTVSGGKIENTET
jgi:hypothetical protein